MTIHRYGRPTLAATFFFCGTRQRRIMCKKKIESFWKECKLHSRNSCFFVLILVPRWRCYCTIPHEPRTRMISVYGKQNYVCCCIIMIVIIKLERTSRCATGLSSAAAALCTRWTAAAVTFCNPNGHDVFLRRTTDVRNTRRGTTERFYPPPRPPPPPRYVANRFSRGISL